MVRLHGWAREGPALHAGASQLVTAKPDADQYVTRFAAYNYMET